MTTPATAPRLNYIADGSTTAFTFNFKIADSNSIAVYVGSTLKTLTTDYTVTFDSGTSGTGTIVFLLAPAASSNIYLIRDTDNVRSTDFQEGGAFLAATINAELDRLTQGIQDVENRLNTRVFSIAEPQSETGKTFTIGDSATRASKQLAFDASGNLIVTSAGSGTVTSVATGTGLTGGPITTTGTISIDTATTVDVSTAQTLTNKTINASNNTLSNIANSSLTNSTITVVGDDSTGTAVSLGETFKIAGAGGVTTAVSGDTLTVTGPTGTLSNVVEDTTPQLGGDLDVNGQSIVSVSNGDITLDANGTGRILLSPGTNGVQVTTGNLSVNAGYLESEGVRIEDNKISTWRSNDNLILDPAGTGVIQTNSNINLNGYKVVGGSTAAPSADGDLANKKYVDDQLGSFSSNLILSGTTNVTAASTSVTTTVAGNAEMIVTDDGVRILGNLTVDGTQTILNTSVLSVEDNIITVNRNISTVGAMPTNSGLEINRGDASAATLYWNETDDKWTVGSNTFVAGTFEGNLNGSTITLTGTAALDGVTITDNTISTNASNANLEISANGTGSVALGAGTIDNTVLAYNVLQGLGASDRGATRSYTKTVDWSTASSNADRIYANTDLMAITVSGSGTGSSRERVRQIQNIQIDSAGYNLPYNHGLYGANTNVVATELRNSSATASSVSEVTGQTSFVKVGDNSTAGDLTVTNMTGQIQNLSIVAPTGTTMSVTNAYGNISAMEPYGGSGTVDVTNYYAFYAKDEASAPATNQYGFYVEDDAWQNRIGGVTLQNGAINTDGITINDNDITTSRSNDNLNISANGTGYITLGTDDFDVIQNNTRNDYGTNIVWTGSLGSTDRKHVYNVGIKGTLSSDLTSSGGLRSELRGVLDTNGYDVTATSTQHQRGLNLLNTNAIVQNTGGSASTATEANAINQQLIVSALASDQTLTHAQVNSAVLYGYSSTGLTAAITNGYGYISYGMLDDGGSGSKTLASMYHFRADKSGIVPSTAEYGFYSNDDDLLNRAGKFERYREKINALTSSSTITVDCGLAPVHTVTLDTNTGFVVSNLGTGQTVTIIITQDGTGNRTASFGTDTSTAVKFPGGVPSLSAGGGDIDIVTVFNDGTNYLGNIAKDYS